MRITPVGAGKPKSQPALVAGIHNHVLAIRDLIEAVDNNRAPLCDPQQEAMTVEMICASFESHHQNAHVEFPLEQRDNPLSHFTS